MKGGACRAFDNPGCNHLPNLPLLVLWSGYLEPFLADIPPPILNLNTKSLKEKGDRFDHDPTALVSGPGEFLKEDLGLSCPVTTWRCGGRGGRPEVQQGSAGVNRGIILDDCLKGYRAVLN